MSPEKQSWKERLTTTLRRWLIDALVVLDSVGIGIIGCLFSGPIFHPTLARSFRDVSWGVTAFWPLAIAIPALFFWKSRLTASAHATVKHHWLDPIFAMLRNYGVVHSTCVGALRRRYRTAKGHDPLERLRIDIRLILAQILTDLQSTLHASPGIRLGINVMRYWDIQAIPAPLKESIMASLLL